MLVLIGGFAQVYVIIIGGQAFPLEIFPGKQIIESSFYDGVVNHYHPSLPEWSTLQSSSTLMVNPCAPASPAT